MNIKQIIINFFTEISPRYSIPLMIEAVVLLSAWLMVRRMNPPWKNFAYGVIVIGILRLALFGQPFSWGFYKDHLTVDDVGWRQQSAINAEYYKYFKNVRPIEYLAVGSSQTLAVYEAYSKKHNHLIVFDLAGMSPLDFYLYREYIAAKNPKTVLLYLSEFDLTRMPRLEASKSSPAQSFGLMGILPMLYEVSKKAHSETDFKEMIAGEFLPEYKYSFVFRGFLDKLTGKNQALRVPSLYGQLSPEAQEMQKNAKGLLDEMDEAGIKYNKYFLARFLSYCRTKSIQVIMIEGHYNPVAFSEKSEHLNRMVRQELEDLDRKFDHVIFLTRSKVPQILREDYRDVMHVKPEAGYRFAEALFKTLGSIRRDDDR